MAKSRFQAYAILHFGQPRNLVICTRDILIYIQTGSKAFWEELISYISIAHIFSTKNRVSLTSQLGSNIAMQCKAAQDLSAGLVRTHTCD
jgi:hypothetical protein